ncbi:MAG: helix-turn-helix transcriptional regulator [Oscillospiraceae bacterium]|nr:helix-turn-helix transcriptional regulator [Oscillospiraceae bacterium]
MAYYKRLRDLREDNNYTQKQIAELLFTTQPQYYRYESGTRDLPCELLVILAKIYNVSTDYILGLTDELPSHK